MNEREMSAMDDDERRVAPRVRTLKRARLMFNNRFSTIDCVVRNVSATGALLTIDTAVQLPKIFEIRIGEDGDIRPAKLVYRREMFAGIHFLDQADDTGARDAPQDPARASQEFRSQEPEGIEPVRSAPLPAALRDRFAWARFDR